MSEPLDETVGAPTGRGMIAMVFALLGGSVLTCVALATAANSDPGFAVEPDYYGKAVRWDQTTAEHAASAALGWTLTLATRPAGPGEVQLLATLRTADGRLVEGARLHLEAFANARAAAIHEVDMIEEAGVHQAIVPIGTPGLWELRWRAVRGTEVWSETLRRELGVTR